MSKLMFNGHSYTGGSVNSNLAADVVYDNTASGLVADDVQEAIDEIAPVKSSIGNIDNVFVSTPAVGDTLVWDGSAWINGGKNEACTGVTPESIIKSWELSIRRVGKVISFSVVFQFNSAPSANQSFATGFPSPFAMLQIPAICVSGTKVGQTQRVRISSGILSDWYSASGFFTTGNTYLVTATYLEA